MVQEITGDLEMLALLMTDGGTKETHVGPPCGGHRMIDTTATATNTGPIGEITKTGVVTILTTEMTVEIGETIVEATREIAIAGEKDGDDDKKEIPF